jgi:hypothetical protein
MTQIDVPRKQVVLRHARCWRPRGSQGKNTSSTLLAACIWEQHVNQFNALARTLTDCNRRASLFRLLMAQLFAGLGSSCFNVGVSALLRGAKT